MSLLSSFIRDQLLKAVEEEFLKHEPDIQDSIVQQIDAFASECIEWVKSKLGAPEGDKE